MGLFFFLIMTNLSGVYFVKSTATCDIRKVEVKSVLLVTPLVLGNLWKSHNREVEGIFSLDTN